MPGSPLTEVGKDPMSHALEGSRPRLRQPAGEEPETLFPWPLSPKERHHAAGPDSIAALFDDEPHVELRHIKTLAEVEELATQLRRRKYSIVLTNGSFDLLHVGHSMYLARAREFGDFLIVGVDSDAKVRERKSKTPLIPEIERLQMLTYQRSVGAVFLKKPGHKTWTLIEHVRPDVLVVTLDAYTPKEIKAIESRFHCKVKVLHRRAMVSTSGRLRAARLGESVLGENTPLLPLDPDR